MTSLVKQALAVAVTLMSISACYGQWGVAAGAGVEQWNRSRELDMQQQQIDLQKKMQQREIERLDQEQAEYLRRQARAEEERRRYEEEQRQLQAKREAARTRRARNDFIIDEFEKTRGPDGAQAAAAIRGQIYGASLFKEYPDISEQQVRAALEEKTESVRGIREAKEKVAKFLASKREYQREENAALFHDELNKILDEVDSGKIPPPGSLEKLIEITHQRVKQILMASKSGKKSAKQI